MTITGRAFVRHVRAAQVHPGLLGRDVLVTDPLTGRLVHGGLSDVAQHPTAHRTELWVGGQPAVVVHDDTTVTIGGLDDVIGGAA